MDVDDYRWYGWNIWYDEFGVYVNFVLWDEVIKLINFILERLVWIILNY